MADSHSSSASAKTPLVTPEMLAALDGAIEDHEARAEADDDDTPLGVHLAAEWRKSAAHLRALASSLAELVADSQRLSFLFRGNYVVDCWKVLPDRAALDSLIARKALLQNTAPLPETTDNG